MKDITDSNYNHAKKVFEDFEIKSWCEYHDFYLNPIQMGLCGATD